MTFVVQLTCLGHIAQGTIHETVTQRGVHDRSAQSTAAGAAEKRHVARHHSENTGWTRHQGLRAFGRLHRRTIQLVTSSYGGASQGPPLARILDA